MKFVLIKSRHNHKNINDLPVIFDNITDMQIFDFDYHKKIIHTVLKEKSDILELYVTGLTPLLISVLNYCKLFDIKVLLYHYDKETNKYRAQTIL
jgi:hypothetical protein